MIDVLNKPVMQMTILDQCLVALYVVGLIVVLALAEFAFTELRDWWQNR